MEDGRLSIDNRSGVSAEGEIILNISQESTPDPGCSFWYAPYIRGYPGWGDDLCVHWSGHDDEPSAHDQCCYHFANIPADFKVPDYVEADSVITDAGSSQTVLTASDGTEYILAEDCDIFPYLTRNIVTLDDLTQGKKVVVWSGR